MKPKTISKKITGQVQVMGKGGIKQISNIAPVQPIQNYNNNYNMNQMPIYPMNQVNQMYPMNQMYDMNMMNQANPYPYWNQNNQMNNNNKNVYENSKKNYLENNNNYNNPMVRNAKMVLNNNMNNLNNMNGYKHNLKNKKKSQSAKYIKSNNDGYNSSNNNNGYNSSNNNINNNYPYNNMNNNISPSPQIKKLKDYQFMEFHPYTLKDYKELTRNPVVMGPLGANIGTKEWEQKRNKMKKMMNYSNNINKEHKGIKSLKKDTPKDEIKKLTQEKIEKSIRHRTYEYGKLIRTGKYKEDYEEKDFNHLNNINNQNIIPEDQENEDANNDKYELNNMNENNHINNKNIMVNENNFDNNNNYMNEENNNIENFEKEKIEMNYGQLLKQNEEYKSKIQDIKDQLLD